MVLKTARIFDAAGRVVVIAARKEYYRDAIETVFGPGAKVRGDWSIWRGHERLGHVEWS